MAHNLKTLICAGIVTVALCSLSHASTWTKTYDKGLIVHTIGYSGTGKLTLVCDPENLWAAPEQGLKAQYSLSIKYQNTELRGNSVTISTDNYSKALPITSGNYHPEDQTHWNALIEALQTSGTLNVSTGFDHFEIIIDKPLETQCHMATKGIQPKKRLANYFSAAMDPLKIFPIPRP